MKKGLTMLVAAMVITGLVCVIGSAAALVHTDTMAATGAYVFPIEGLIAVMFVGTVGIMLVLTRKQIKSVGRGLDPPIAHLTPAATSAMSSKTGKLL